MKAVKAGRSKRKASKQKSGRVAALDGGMNNGLDWSVHGVHIAHLTGILWSILPSALYTISYFQHPDGHSCPDSEEGTAQHCIALHSTA